MRKNFEPTEAQIRCAEAVFKAMAHESLVRPIVEAYERAILEKHQFRIARRWVERGSADCIILDRKRSYLLEDRDAQVFHAECFKARDAAGLKVERPENCPLLEAEHKRIEAEHALLKAIATTPGLDNFGNGIWNPGLRAKAIDLSLKLLAPFVKTGAPVC